jgi:hypothetical protein
MNPQHPLPRCVRRFVTSAELEADRIHAIREELPREYWPRWVPGDGDARLVFHLEAPGRMTSVPPVGGGAVAS